MFMIPFRLVTAIVGLVMGYYVGFWLEGPIMTKEDILTRYIKAYSDSDEATRLLAAMGDDDDDECGCINFDDSDDEDDDTEYSQ